MAEEGVPAQEPAQDSVTLVTADTPRRHSLARRLRWLWLIPLALLLAIGAGLIWLDSGGGHRFLAQKISAFQQKSGLCFRVGRIEGSIYRRATLRDVALCDPKGVWLKADRVDLDWYPFAYINNRLSIDRLTVRGADWLRMPALNAVPRQGPILPNFDIFIRQFAAPDIIVEQAVAGRRQRAALSGSADIRNGRARVLLDGNTDGSGDLVHLNADITPDKNRFLLSGHVSAPAGGVVAHLAGLSRPLVLDLNGRGTWKNWRGRLVASSAGAELAALDLAARQGSYRIVGPVNPALLTKGIVARLTEPVTNLDLTADYANRILTARGTLRSGAIDAQIDGGYDFAQGGFDQMRVGFRLLKPSVLFKSLGARNLVGFARLNGPFNRLTYSYQLSSPEVKIGTTGFTNARAAGQGTLTNGVSRIPVRFSADRVTGTGQIAERVLTRLKVDGVLTMAGSRLTGRNILIRTDQINASADVAADLATGRYRVGLTGTIRNFAVPGLGTVDAGAKVQVAPGARGGLSVAGQIRVVARSITNGTLRNFAGGLPRVDTFISFGPDGVFRFNNFRIVAPNFTFAGNGVRNADGTFNITGTGRHVKYGAFRMTLAGTLDHPRVVLDLASPFAAAGLKNVNLVLNPTAEGFAFTVKGTSMLGPFDGTGMILLPKGGSPTIRIDRLTLTNTVVQGSITLGQNGPSGHLTLAGGGVNGTIDLTPRGNGTAVGVRITATNARFGGAQPIIIRRATVSVSGFIAGNNTTIDATVQAQGISRGSFIIGRLNAKAHIVNGVGQVTADIAGTRGSAFDFHLNVAVGQGRYVISGEGHYQRRPIRIRTPAVLTVSNGRWRLAPTVLAYGGGTLRLAAAFGQGVTEVDARMDRMPLRLADLFSSSLGFGGRATGVITYVDGPGAPVAGVALRVNNLTRSGLVLTSTPIDLAVNAKLTADNLGLRAVIANNGQIIGRVQARVAPLSGGSLVERITRSPLFAQARFSGEVSTLWRLTGVELFDLSGPGALGADITGTIADPVIRGAVRTDKARLESVVTGTVLTNVKTRGTFDGSRLVLTELSGTTGGSGGGSISGSGTFLLSGTRGLGISLDLQTRNAALLNTDSLAATVSGPLKVRSEGSGGVISGNLTLDRGRYRLGASKALEQLPNVKVREINAPADMPLPKAIASPWRLDVTVDAPNQLTVTGMGIDSEWSARVHVTGDVTNPRITGVADLVRGEYSFAGKRFRLDRGQIRFTGEVPADPQLDIVAVSEVQGINARITVTGTGQRPEIAFSSNPALPEDELLSRILFGSSITNISAAEALQLGAAVASLRGGGGGGLDPINALRRAVGLDRLRILPANAALGTSTAIAGGKYITRRVYVEVVTDGKGYSATNLEFQITRWLSILGTISTIGRQSLNARVSHDY